MIKIEHTEVVGWEHAIRGMRNPMNSWDKSDSCTKGSVWCSEFCGNAECECEDGLVIGPNDLKLMTSLSKAGTDHRKFMRMIVVYLDITAPLYWWKEFDTYKVGTVANSCSTMHKIHEKEFTLEDFSCEHLLGGLNHFDEREVPYLDFSPLQDDSATYSPAGIVECVSIPMLNLCREKWIELDRKIKGKEFSGDESVFSMKQKQKDVWWQMIQLLPSSYNQKRTVMLNYEVLANIYHSRKNHKLDEWREFCKWIEKLPYSELITGERSEAKRVAELGEYAVMGIDMALTEAGLKTEAPSKLIAKIKIEPDIDISALADKFSRENTVTKEELEHIFKNAMKEDENGD